MRYGTGARRERRGRAESGAGVAEKIEIGRREGENVSKRAGDDLRAVRRNGFTGPAKKGGPGVRTDPGDTGWAGYGGMHFHTLATTRRGARARALSIGGHVGPVFPRIMTDKVCPRAVMPRASAGGTRPRWPPGPDLQVGIPVGRSEFIDRAS